LGLIVSSSPGGVTQHLFHRLCLDETFYGSVNHRVEALVQCKFKLKEVLWEGVS
jgi:hypothetical protein